MANRKLSLKQRVAVRKELAKKTAQGVRQADLLRGVAEKYGITTNTARWYLKSLDLTKQSRPRKTATKRSRRWGKRIQSLVARGRNGLVKVVRQAQSIAEESLKRAMEAKKLIPKWQVYVKRESHLRKAESLLRKQLRSVSLKAKTLHRRIQRLTPD